MHILERILVYIKNAVERGHYDDNQKMRGRECIFCGITEGTFSSSSSFCISAARAILEIPRSSDFNYYHDKELDDPVEDIF